jgi:hypothetical protein
MRRLHLWILAMVLAGPIFGNDALKSTLLTVWKADAHAFTPAVRSAYLAYARSVARADLAERGADLPDEFLAWIHANPLVERTVYAAHDRPAELLLHLYALRLDLGQARFETYHQLALAAAVVLAKQAEPADISPRDPIVLQIGGDTRVPVQTNTPERPLDTNDHIINFLNAHEVEENVVVGHKEPELKYDKKGIAIPQRGKKEAIVETRTRTLYAADVLASADLQATFNAYMAEMGETLRIDCGDQRVHWTSKEPLQGDARKSVSEAYKLFRAAYEAKGLLPTERDPIPSIAERCRYIIRNFEHEFPEGLRDWPQFPITAPWPVMTLLVDDDQPLREREERWLAFRDKGEFKKMGEYIGGIAQQFDIQSARRLKPFPFTYNTVQMMMKDGGVCGTMASISARSHIALGIPACQAIQPGHCALVSFQYDSAKKQYACVGGQYATGGHEATTPFARWYLGEPAKKFRRNPGFGVQPNPRKPMVYHRSVAWAVNHGLESFLDAMMAHSFYQQLGADQREHGLPLLFSGLSHNPYAFLVTDAAQAAAPTALAQLDFWARFSKELQALGDSRGCKPDGLYATTVKGKVFASFAKLPLPEDIAGQTRVYEFLKAEDCDVPKALIRYRLACEGLPALLEQTAADFRAHLVASRLKPDAANDAACKRMEAALKSTAECIPDKEARVAWAAELLPHAKGREKYIGRWDRVSTDPAVNWLTREAKQRLPDNATLTRSLLDRLTQDLRESVSGERDLGRAQQLAASIEAAAKFAKDETLREEWLQELADAMKGNETFGKKRRKDPCADLIKRLRND